MWSDGISVLQQLLNSSFPNEKCLYPTAVSLTDDLELHRHLSHEVGQIHRADIQPRVTHFSLPQDQRRIPSLVQALIVQRGPLLLDVGQAVRFAVVGQNQAAVPSELVAPLYGETRPGERRRGVGPEAAIQQHWPPESGLHGDGCSGHTQDH